MDITQTAFTDEQDYASGTTAAITADGFSPGATVEFKVEHVLDGGPDEVLGTADPDDSADVTFLLSATGVSAGADGLLGTADDEATGELATLSFTESGRSELARNQSLFQPSKPTKPRVRPDRLVGRFISVSRNTVSHLRA